MGFRMKINKDREFAIAYRLFSYLGDDPVSARTCAAKHGIPRTLMSCILRNMRDFGLVITKRGNGMGGTYRAPDATVRDLFVKYGVEFQEGAEFENKINETLARYTKDKKCCVCSRYASEVTENGSCNRCTEMNTNVANLKRKARCGHYSLTRYFNCENCLPILEDNTTPEDWGIGFIDP